MWSCVNAKGTSRTTALISVISTLIDDPAVALVGADGRWRVLRDRYTYFSGHIILLKSNKAGTPMRSTHPFVDASNRHHMADKRI